MFGINVDRLDVKQAVCACIDYIGSKESDSGCKYVVTPNVDHVIMLQDNIEFQRSYEEACLVLADGNPIVWASRLLGRPLECTVPGSDLVPAIMSQAVELDHPLKIFLLGAGSGVAEQAAINIHDEYTNVQVVGCDSPAFGFHVDSEENKRIVDKVNASAADLLVLGLGAPKQELWINEFRNEIHVPLAICAGAVIDFMAGEKKRAPRWVRKLALEWLHRVLSEPRRLGGRYLKGLCVFPLLVVKEVFGAKREIC